MPTSIFHGDDDDGQTKLLRIFLAEWRMIALDPTDSLIPTGVIGIIMVNS
jgi:hypothetical protein